MLNEHQDLGEDSMPSHFFSLTKTFGFITNNMFHTLWDKILFLSYFSPYYALLAVSESAITDYFFVVKGFKSDLRIFHSYWDLIITGEGPEMVAYGRHSWSLSSVDSVRRDIHL